jgi:hypothetical protein
MKPSYTRLALVLFGALLLTGCRMQLGNRLLNGGAGPASRLPTEVPPTQIPTAAPTGTPIPTATATLTPTPDPAAAGLPPETSGMNALDFVASMCKTDWFTESGSLPCPGNENNSNAGFVLRLPGDQQDLPASYPVLLMYPPQAANDTIFSKYPAFTVQKGDRFRAVITCRLHSFCDVDFGLGYFVGNGGQSGLAHWPYRFTDNPMMIDYPLDGLAGLTVRFSLSLRAAGPSIDAYGVWILPHIYRPKP